MYRCLSICLCVFGVILLKLRSTTYAANVISGDFVASDFPSRLQSFDAFRTDPFVESYSTPEFFEKLYFAASAGRLSIPELVNALKAHAFEVEEQDTNFSNRDDVTCFQRVTGLITAINDTLPMLDAAGKPPAGLLTGGLLWLGSYSQCTGFSAPDLDIGGGQLINMSGHWCMGTTAAQSPLPHAEEAQDGGHELEADSAGGAGLLGSVGLNVGLCLPNKCSDDELTSILNLIIKLAAQQLLNVTIEGRVMNVTCRLDHTPFEWRGQLALSVVAIVAILVLIATVCELVYPFIMSQLAVGDSMRTPLVSETEEGGVSTTEDERPNHSAHTPPPAYGAVNVNQYAPRAAAERSKIFAQNSLAAQVETPENPYWSFVFSWSALRNSEKIFNSRLGSDQLTALHGIRFLSMAWVILGHTYAFGYIICGNILEIFDDVGDWTLQIVLNGTFSVDTFFMLSGLLVTYLFMKQLDNTNLGDLPWTMLYYYFHRFYRSLPTTFTCMRLRLTPAYALILMVYQCLTPYLGDGPIWPQLSDGMDANCRDNWWTNLLYVNNLVNVDKGCMGWTWFLANDMQFHIVAPLVLIPLFFYEIVGLAVLGGVLVVSFTVTAWICTHYGIPASSLHVYGPNSTMHPENEMTYYYIRPWCRIGPYLVGMLYGYALYKTKCRPKIPAWVVIGGWICSAAAMIATILALRDVNKGSAEWSLTGDTLYNTLARSVWGAAVGWVAFACVTGYGGFVNTILSWPAFVPVSRLTYCAYLIHPVVVYSFVLSTQQTYHYRPYFMVYWFTGNLVIGYFAAFFCSIGFEAPFIGMEKAVKRVVRSFRVVQHMD